MAPACHLPSVTVTSKECIQPSTGSASGACVKMALPPRKQPERSPRKKGGDLGGGAGGLGGGGAGKGLVTTQEILGSLVMMPSAAKPNASLRSPNQLPSCFLSLNVALEDLPSPPLSSLEFQRSLIITPLVPKSSVTSEPSIHMFMRIVVVNMPGLQSAFVAGSISSPLHVWLLPLASVSSSGCRSAFSLKWMPSGHVEMSSSERRLLQVNSGSSSGSPSPLISKRLSSPSGTGESATANELPPTGAVPP
mmetsp:Transcript_61857/g.149008  ORF Transcript_61857/g.149008 Transcript_61857/m.149008 type:complete len:250 (+) Transcript_61857:257-1006(+)